MLSTIGSIATFISQNLPDLPTGISGNLIIIADNARQYVENFTGVILGSNSIPNAYIPPIIDFAMADTIDLYMSQGGGTDIALGELRLSEGGILMSSKEYRMMGEMKLKSLGRNYLFAQSLS